MWNSHCELKWNLGHKEAAANDIWRQSVQCCTRKGVNKCWTGHRCIKSHTFSKQKHQFGASFPNPNVIWKRSSNDSNQINHNLLKYHNQNSNLKKSSRINQIPSYYTSSSRSYPFRAKLWNFRNIFLSCCKRHNWLRSRTSSFQFSSMKNYDTFCLI